MSFLPLVYHPHYSIPFPAGHRFPMQKFALLEAHLRREGVLSDHNLFVPSPLSLTTLMHAHSPDYVQTFVRGKMTDKAMREIGLPWSDWLVERTLRAVSGTLLTADLALEYGMAGHLAGGTHHAHQEYGTGFCIFNDQAVAAIHLIEAGKAKKVLILDCDVHQGDGSASMCAAYPQIETVSWHCEENYPAKKQTAGINIQVPKGCDDEGYLMILQRDLPGLLDDIAPDFVFYDAGVDVHQDDRLGFLNLTDEGIWNRDEYLIGECLKRKIPLACVIGGGYDKDQNKLAWRHSIVHRVMNSLCHKIQP
jgi:acetoin utilization deacetylase AcuC-like enzyme